jgi:hypothetical protein
MPQTHPRSAMHIAQLDGLGLWSLVIGRIQNPDPPLARCRIDLNLVLRSEPSQAPFAQFLQPVIIRDRLGQLLAGAIDASAKIALPIAPQRAQRHFDWRGRARPDCQNINDIEQDLTR